MSEPLVDELTRLLGPKGVHVSSGKMAPWLQDFRGRMTGWAQAVVLPATTAEAASAVVAATSRELPVFPQGGNTGVCYGAVPCDGIVVGMRRMRSVRSVDMDSGLLTVDAGMTLAEVHDVAEQHGMQFPLHLGSEGTAQIGGLISTNAGGTGVLRYGAMRELVAGVEVVLADGRVLRDMHALRKDNTGYPLRHLVAGAEGTLGVVTGAVLKMAPMMRERTQAWVAAPSIGAVLALLQRLRAEFGDVLEAFELLDRAQASYVMRHIPGVRMPLSDLPDYSVLIELAATRDGLGLTEMLETVLAGALEQEIVTDAVVARNAAQAEEIRRFRHSVTEANKLEGVGVVMDTSVRPGEIEAFVAEADEVVGRMFPEAERAITAHIGDGNVHYIVMFPKDIWAGYADPIAKEMEVERAVHDVVVAHDGSFSAEHGVGRKLTEEMDRLIDPVRLEMLRGIKKVFDPKNLMNPGVLLSTVA